MPSQVVQGKKLSISLVAMKNPNTTTILAHHPTDKYLMRSFIYRTNLIKIQILAIEICYRTFLCVGSTARVKLVVVYSIVVVQQSVERLCYRNSV